MFPDLLPIETSAAAAPARRTTTPALFSTTGRARQCFWEFFTAHIRNPNTRLAYLAAVRRFAEWCEHRRIALDQVEPMVVAAYIEQLSGTLAPATVKQHLAALRMLFDWLVVGQVLPFNPASSVRGPKHVVKTGKTPVLSAKETRTLLDGIGISTVVGLRDRALLGVLVYSFARVSAAVSLRVADYYTQGPRSFFRLHEKGGRYNVVPAHHTAQAYVDAYLIRAIVCGRIELGTTGHHVKHFFLSGRLDREGSPEVATFITRDSTSEHRQQHAAGQSEAYVSARALPHRDQTGHCAPPQGQRSPRLKVTRCAGVSSISW